MELLTRLWNGQEGLAKTYWGYGFLGNIIFWIAIKVMAPLGQVAFIAVLAFMAYIVVVNVGIWRAATLYAGAKVWSICAKIAVVILPASIILGIVAAIALPMMGSKSQRVSTPPAEVDTFDPSTARIVTDTK